MSTALPPSGLFQHGLTQGRDLRSDLGGEGALAMVDQLQSAAVDREWLDLAAADLRGCLQRAQQDGAFLDGERRRLQKRCSAEVVGHPLLSEWMVALTTPIIDVVDLEAAAEFLERARMFWEMSDGPPVGQG